MVGTELKTERKPSLPESEYLPQKQFDMMNKYNINEGFRDILETVQKDIQYANSIAHNSKYGKREWNTEETRRILSKISSDLLSLSPSVDRHSSTTRNITELEHAYKNVMEMFLSRMEKFLHSINDLREDLTRSVRLFHKISRLTAQVTLVTSATEVALLAGSALHKVFNFNWNPKISILSTLMGSLSITSSVFALTYMKQSTQEITRDVKGENRFFMDLVAVHKKGNWIDKEVIKLFPYGIDLNFYGKKEMEEGTTFDDKISWKLYLCSVIILTNIQKDATLFKDERFLMRVKLFVESQAAEIWFYRIKIKKLLDALLNKMEAISSKKFVADHEVPYSRTALYLYPVLLPWMVTTWGSGLMRFLCSSIAGYMAFRDLADYETEEYDELKKISDNFEKDFEEITEICNILDYDYD